MSEWRTPEDGSFDVLALSGGGPNGAFGAGVLAGWTARGDRPVFDHVTGRSPRPHRAVCVSRGRLG